MRRGYTKDKITWVGSGARETWRQLSRQYSRSDTESRPIEAGNVVRIFERSLYLDVSCLPDNRSTLTPMVLIGGDNMSDSPLLSRMSGSPIAFNQLDVETGSTWTYRQVDSDTRAVLTIGDSTTLTLNLELLKQSNAIPTRISSVSEIIENPRIQNRAEACVNQLITEGYSDGLGWLSKLGGPLDQHSQAPEQFGEYVSSWVQLLTVDDVREAMFNPIADVIGRGLGTTPSGDDVTSAILLTLNRILSKRESQRLQAIGREIVASANGNTSRVSAGLMEQSVYGRAPTVVSEFLQTIFSDVPEERLYSSLVDVCDIGHTSGVDICVGILTTLLSIVPKLTRKSHHK
ncbi:hypothetical protein DJ68_14790 [Halorubrum sp. C3]|nr:hypothetical protein DJ68_14790 [Halorubrum sp. C3]